MRYNEKNDLRQLSYRTIVHSLHQLKNRPII